MERLVCCNSNPIAGKLGRYSTFIPRIFPPEFARGGDNSFSLSTTTFPLLLRRFNSVTSSANGSCFQFQDGKGRSLAAAAAADTGNESDPELHFVQRIAQNWCDLKKVLNWISPLMLAPIVIASLHSVFASPSLASFSPTVAVGQGLIRSKLMSSAWTGFFAGCLHTLSGPDHLAALAPLSIGRTRLESAAVGALWGCGHDAGQVLFGLVFLLLKDQLHIEMIKTWGSIVVGLTLIVIGVMGIKEGVETGIGTHEQAQIVPKQEKKKIGLTTFATGIVHGLQPDALMMILPALALPSRLAGAAFLVMFLVGTIFAMGSYTVFIGSCSQVLKERVPKITEKLTWASSLVAIGLGIAIMVSQFVGISLY